MRYILGYFALMLGLSGLGMLISGQVLGLFLILAAAALIYWLIRVERERRRDRRFGDYGPAIEGYEKHFGAASAALEAKLPQDALDNPALLELLSGEDADRSEAIRADYDRLRQRFHEWQEDVERMRGQVEAGAVGLPGPFAEHYARLDRELSELLDEVERLEARAAEAKGFGDNPLEEMARAVLKLEQVVSMSRAAFADAVPTELAEDLARGGERLDQARGELERGAERPLVAARLAREAYALADGVSRRMHDLVEQPREASARRSELERSSTRLAEEVTAAKAKFDLASEHHASACLRAIGGLGAGAEQAVERARGLIAAAATPAEAFCLEEAQDALGRAAGLVNRIDSHLAELEQAALRAPARVEEAELASDRAWASATASAGVEAGADPIVGRARELAAQARAELGQARPDWFRALSLANRALEVVRELAPARGASEEMPVETNDGVERARRSAEAALAEVSSLVGSVEARAGAENMATLCLESGESAYAKGVALQKQIADADDPDAVARAAMESFRLAEDAADAAREHALRLQGPRVESPTPRWGRFGAAFGSD